MSDNFWTLPKIPEDFWALPKMTRWLLIIPAVLTKLTTEFTIKYWSVSKKLALSVKCEKLVEMCEISILDRQAWVHDELAGLPCYLATLLPCYLCSLVTSVSTVTLLQRLYLVTSVTLLRLLPCYTVTTFALLPVSPCLPLLACYFSYLVTLIPLLLYNLYLIRNLATFYLTQILSVNYTVCAVCYILLAKIKMGWQAQLLHNSYPL